MYKINIKLITKSIINLKSNIMEIRFQSENDLFWNPKFQRTRVFEEFTHNEKISYALKKAQKEGARALVKYSETDAYVELKRPKIVAFLYTDRSKETISLKGVNTLVKNALKKEAKSLIVKRGKEILFAIFFNNIDLAEKRRDFPVVYYHSDGEQTIKFLNGKFSHLRI
jgi:hypothetical protein